MTELRENVKKILEINLYMTIAVSDRDNFPWIANLYYAYDDQVTLYWYSSENTRHSQIISQNPAIAVAIFDSTAVGDDVNAVYIEAEAHEITNEQELAAAIQVFADKMLATDFLPNQDARDAFVADKKDFLGETEVRMYKAMPQKIYTLAPVDIVNGKYIDRRVEISIDELRSAA